MRRSSQLLVLPLLMVFLSCEKKDVPVAPNGETAYQIDLGNNYTYQAYFDLSSGEMKQKNAKLDWDLAFESDVTTSKVFLNSARLMKAFNTESTNFDSVYTFSPDYEWKWDKPSGRSRATVIGDWANEQGDSKMKVYLIDLGANEDGFPIGYRKLQILSSNSNSYQIKYADLDGANEQTLKVDRDQDLVKNCFSMSTNALVVVEPVKSEWDLHFTNYTEELWDGVDTVAYIVTGVLLNSYGTLAAFDDSLKYEEIAIEDVQGLNLSSAANAIGYNWKYFDFDDQHYTIVPGYNYVIQDIDGIFYKLRFVGFYNSSGEKGSPQFQYEKL